MSASRAERSGPAGPSPWLPAVLAAMLTVGGSSVSPVAAQGVGGPIRLTPAPATVPAVPPTSVPPTSVPPSAAISLEPTAGPSPAPPAGPPAAAGQPIPLMPDAGEVPSKEVISTVRQPSPVRAEALGPPDPDGAGVLSGVQGLGDDLWRGIDRATVVELVAALPTATPSPAAKSLQRRLLLSAGSPAVSPTGEAVAPARRFGALRIATLAAMGDPKGAADLAFRLPDALADEAAAQALTDAELTAGAIDCPRAAERGKSFASAYWVRLEVYCRARAGDRAGAAEALGRLRAQSFADDGFVPLGEALIGGPPPAVRTLANPDILTLAALRLAQIALPVEAAALSDPRQLALVALNGATDPVTRAIAGEKAAAGLFLDVRALLEIYRAVPARGDELLRMRDLAARERSARTRALLHQAMAGAMEGGRRVGLAGLELDLVDPALRAGPVGNAATALLDTISPTPDALALAPAAARLYFALGRGDAGRRWLDLALRGGRGAEVAWLWPLAVVAGETPAGDAAMAAWIDGETRGGDEAAKARVTAQMALLQAAGVPVSAEQWVRTVGAVPAASASSSEARPPTADPALWQRLVEASAAGRVGETVLAGLLLLGDGGPATAAPAIVARVADGLRAVGLDQDARAIVREALAVLATPAGQ